MKMLMGKGAEALAGLVRWVRGERVILDADLARLYGVTTRALNQAVRRNPRRFPPAFILHIANEDIANLKSQNVTSSLAWGGRRKPAFGFTEHGALMVASVLNSDRAIAMSIYVIKAFVKMREELVANETVLRRLAEIDQTLLMHDEGLRDLYEKLMPLLEPEPEREESKIGPLRSAPAHWSPYTAPDPFILRVPLLGFASCWNWSPYTAPDPFILRVPLLGFASRWNWSPYTAPDLCRYPSVSDDLGAYAPAQSGMSLRDGWAFRYREGIGFS